MINKYLIASLICVSISVFNNGAKSQTLIGEYFGQSKPGLVPKIFAPGIVSIEGHVDFAGTFTPDMLEYYFTRRKDDGDNQIFVMKQINGEWSMPTLAAFSYNTFEFEPFISPDGRHLYFGSKRPLPDSDTLNTAPDIWKLERNGGVWTNPQPVTYASNEKRFMMYVSASRQNRMYYYSSYENGGISFSEILDGNLSEPEKLGNEINAPSRGSHPFIAPDESYIIFDSSSRPDDFGGSDLYISFKNSSGNWQQAVNMGSTINSDADEFAASVSPDGKYLFFAVYKDETGDIFWVDAKVLEQFKPDRN